MSDRYDFDNIYTYHEPTGPEQLKRYVDLREAAKELAKQIHRECPPSREQSRALTNLEQAVFWGNAAIARYPRQEPSADESSDP